MARVPIVTALAPFFGATIFFAQDGKTIETIVVDDETKPPGESLTGWAELGCIELANLLREFEGGSVRRCFNPTTGVWEKRKTKGRQVSLAIEATLQEVSELLEQIAWNAAAIDAADGEFIPNSQPEGIYSGWALVQKQNGTEVTVLASIRVELSMPQAMSLAGVAPTTPQVRLDIMDNALNVGNFGTVTE